MDVKKEPPSVCKTEDGGGDHPNMITRESKYQTAADLSSGGSSGNEITNLRVSHALAARDMAETVQGLYPRFDRYLLSKCEAPELYGIEIRPNALERLYMKYAPEAWKKRRSRDRHRRKRSIRCRLDENIYQDLLLIIHRKGFNTVQDWLESLIKWFVVENRRHTWD